MTSATVPPQTSTARAASHSIAGTLLSRLGPLIGLLFVFALFSALRWGKFATWQNIEIMLLQTAVVGTAALGMTLIIISGGIDLSVGSAIALVTVVVARLLSGFELLGMTVPAQSPLIAALGGVLAGALCGLLIGSLITRLNLAPFIVTLGTWGALRGAAKGLADQGMIYPPPAALNSWLGDLLQSVSGTDRAWMFLPSGVWLLLVLALFVAALLRYTRFGRHIFAIGSNEQTARLCGVPVQRTKILIYSLGGAFFGLAGVLQFSRLSCGDCTTANGMELNIIAAVVIGGASLSGGQGSVLGSLIGALIMTIVSNGCTKLELRNWVQEIVTGGIIVLAVALDRLRQRRA